MNHHRPMQIELDADNCTLSRIIDGPISLQFKSSIPSSSLVSQLISRSTSVELLPPAVRWISPSGSAILFERPPTKVRVMCVYEHSYEIDLPWQLYFFSTSSPERTHVLFSPTVLTSFNQLVVQAPLPNIYRGGRFCIGKEIANKIDSVFTQANSLARLIPLVLDSVWGNLFNDDLLPHWTRPKTVPQPPHRVCAALRHVSSLSSQELADPNLLKSPPISVADILRLFAEDSFAQRFESTFVVLGAQEPTSMSATSLSNQLFDPVASQATLAMVQDSLHPPEDDQDLEEDQQEDHDDEDYEDDYFYGEDDEDYEEADDQVNVEQHLDSPLLTHGEVDA